jgi:hypothetical protein
MHKNGWIRNTEKEKKTIIEKVTKMNTLVRRMMVRLLDWTLWMIWSGIISPTCQSLS